MSSNSVDVGQSGEGALSVSGGASVSAVEVDLGGNAGSRGTLVVSGATSTVTASDYMTVGWSGDAVIMITDGASVTTRKSTVNAQSGSESQITVKGTGSRWEVTESLSLGWSGDAALMITDGASVTTKWSTVSAQSGSESQVTVEGTGSRWVTESLSVGWSGDATLTIANGGSVISNSISVGVHSQSQSAVIVRGAGSTLTGTSAIDLGWSGGSGTLMVTEGGVIHSGYGGLSINGSVMSYATIRGEGSAWICDSYLKVGGYGGGRVSIYDNGLVVAGSRLYMDDYGFEGSSIRMGTGARLAIEGQADASLMAFLGLVDGTDEIQYWNDVAGIWSHLSGATFGTDYTLDYMVQGDLAGYTVLTVNTTIPEPMSLSLLALGGLAVARRRRT